MICMHENKSQFMICKVMSARIYPTAHVFESKYLNNKGTYKKATKS